MATVRTPAATHARRWLQWIVAALAFSCSGTALAATHRVTIEGMAYHPASLRVHRGDRIVWRNDDVVPHTVTAVGQSFDSARIDPGQQWYVDVTRTGQVAYSCAFHPMMRGMLEVE